MKASAWGPERVPTWSEGKNQKPGLTRTSCLPIYISPFSTPSMHLLPEDGESACYSAEQTPSGWSCSDSPNPDRGLERRDPALGSPGVGASTCPQVSLGSKSRPPVHVRIYLHFTLVILIPTPNQYRIVIFHTFPSVYPVKCPAAWKHLSLAHPRCGLWVCILCASRNWKADTVPPKGFQR